MQKDFIILNLKVQANAKTNQIISFENNCLKLKIKAAAIDGKANKELIDFLSEILNIAKSNICLIKGEKSKQKVLKIYGLTNIDLKL